MFDEHIDFTFRFCNAFPLNYFLALEQRRLALGFASSQTVGAVDVLSRLLTLRLLLWDNSALGFLLCNNSHQPEE